MDHRTINELKPTVWIGKKGCTGEIIQEIHRQINTRKMVKIKLLKTVAIDPTVVAALTGTEIVDIRGRTVTLRKRGKKIEGQYARNI